MRRAALGGIGFVLAVALFLATRALAPAEVPAQAPAAPAGKAVAALPQPDLPYGARQGRALFRHDCATCHGEEGAGDGFNAYNLDPRPKDLGDPDLQHNVSDKGLAAIIRSGGGVAGLSNAMPPWGHTLNERQITYLVLYLRTLERKPETSETSETPSSGP